MFQITERNPGAFLKFLLALADRLFMNVNSLVNAAVPTPFGWLIANQRSFDLNSVLAFQGQMLSLARALGSATAVTEPAASSDNEPVGVLVPLRVPSTAARER